MSVPVVFDLTTRLGRRRARTAFVDHGKAVPICWSCDSEILGEKGTVVLAFPERPATLNNLRVVHALCAAGLPLEHREKLTADAANRRAEKHADRERARQATERFARMIAERMGRSAESYERKKAA